MQNVKLDQQVKDALETITQTLAYSTQWDERENLEVKRENMWVETKTI